jgi:hypothetical protein
MAKKRVTRRVKNLLEWYEKESSFTWEDRTSEFIRKNQEKLLENAKGHEEDYKRVRPER